ncbi:hypothetical protein CEXT_52191 [Caerostris extrusa]|uniref:Uncharacterized protein n=1 Tax=Caerostris extrusa TaxID=172846 RepID=A0AAV4RDF9_CAEEX|nr:hypothetical protein CEXT_52191 [Caerostris extrusa]
MDTIWRTLYRVFMTALPHFILFPLLHVDTTVFSEASGGSSSSSLLSNSEFELAFTFARDAAIIAGTSFKSEVIEVDPLVAEYCAFTEEQKTVLFEEIPGMVIDAFMDMCSSFKERSRCKRFEQYLNCGIQEMEKYAAQVPRPLGSLVPDTADPTLTMSLKWPNHF